MRKWSKDQSRSGEAFSRHKQRKAESIEEAGKMEEPLVLCEAPANGKLGRNRIKEREVCKYDKLLQASSWHTLVV